MKKNDKSIQPISPNRSFPDLIARGVQYLKEEATNHSDLHSPTIGTLKYIPAGSFHIDYAKDTISIVSAFRMSETEITREQFEKVMGYDPNDTENSTGQQDPVQYVSWYDTLVFCNKLSQLEGLTPVYSINGSTDPVRWGEVPRWIDNKDYDPDDEDDEYYTISPDKDPWDAVTANWNANGYRLPTEMEWMWAAMGADKDNPGKVNKTGYNKEFSGSNASNDIGDYAWTDENSNGTTHPVGTKQPNELGLYDMSGNVWEWCWDWYTDNYPTGPTTNYKGAATGVERMARGGSWDDDASDASVACCNYGLPYFRISDRGFRVVRP